MFAFTVTKLGPVATGAAEQVRVAWDIELPPTPADVLDVLVTRAAAQVAA